MICFPNAKINLGLNIVEKRSDGYHNIETVFYPIGLMDVLELVPNTTPDIDVSFSSSGIAIPGENNANLCVKAYQLIAKDYPLPPLKVHLHKIIPIGAGLGGGSSDAAFFIKQLNELAELNLSFGEQHHYAKQLGSDCSYFINNNACFAQGKGDELESIRLSLKDYFVALVYPEIHINTATAYSLVKPSKPKQSLEQLIQQPIHTWKDIIFNDFETSVFARYPEISELKKKLYDHGAVYASMSGSGSAVFGIFEKETNLKKEFKSHFVWEGAMSL